MARRASSSINAPAIIGIVIAALIVIGGGIFVLRGKSKSFDGPTLRMSEFQSNGNSMRGMSYSVEGKVQTRYARDSGLGIDLEIDEAGVKNHLFIIIPKDLEEGLNINREEHYAFKIKFEEGGIAVATAVKRL